MARTSRPVPTWAAAGAAVIALSLLLVAGAPTAGAGSPPIAPPGWEPAFTVAGLVLPGGKGEPGPPALSCVPGRLRCVAITLDHRPPPYHLSPLGAVATNDFYAWGDDGPLPAAMASVASLSCPTTAVCVAAGTTATGQAAIARSDTGGARWTMEPIPSGPPGWRPRSLSCPSAMECYVVGDRGAVEPVIARSLDGGIGWAFEPLPPGTGTGELDAIACGASSHCVTAGALAGGALVLWTGDDGAAWQRSAPLALGHLGPVLALSCPTAARCFATSSVRGGVPALLSSADGGARWSGSVVNLASGTLGAISCATPSRCWVADGAGGMLIGTADGGVVWAEWQRFTGLFHGPSSAAVSCADGTDCVAALQGQLVATTTNAGLTADPASWNAPPTGRVPRGSVAPVVARPSEPGVAVDPAEAYAVATRLWNERVLARHDRDPSALAVVESGPLLAEDVEICRAGCAAPPLYPLTHLSVIVPHQATWPASFFASATAGAPCATGKLVCQDLFVATQQAAGRPWRMRFFASYLGTAGVSGGNGPGGYAPPGKANISAASLLGDYAAYLEAIKQTGRAPARSILMPGFLTTGLVSVNRPNPRLLLEEAATDRVTYRPLGPSYQFGLPYGTLTCGTVAWTDTATARWGLRLTQLPDRLEWGIAVPAGTYTRIVADGVHMVCFISTAPTRAFGIADWSGQTSATVRR